MNHLQKSLKTSVYRYKQLPNFLIEDHRYNDISNTGKLLYTLLLSRHSLSKKSYSENGLFHDERGIYVVFTREELSACLHVSCRTVKKYVDELTIKGLIREKRMGHCKANRIYVKEPSDILPFNTSDFAIVSDGEMAPKKDSLPSSESEISTDHEVHKTSDHDRKNLPASNIDYSEPILNKNLSVFQEDSLIQRTQIKRKKDQKKEIEKKKSNLIFQKGIQSEKEIPSPWPKNRQEIRQQISYERFLLDREIASSDEHEWHEKMYLVDQIVEIMMNVYDSPIDSTFMIKGSRYDGKRVKEEFYHLTYDCIRYVYNNIRKAKSIQNLRAYLITTLFLAPGEYKYTLLQQKWQYPKDDYLKHLLFIDQKHINTDIDKNENSTQNSSEYKNNEKICTLLDALSCQSEYIAQLTDNTSYRLIYAMIQRIYTSQLDTLKVNEETYMIAEIRERMEKLNAMTLCDMVFELEQNIKNTRYLTDHIFSLIIKFLPLSDHNMAI